MNQIEPVNVAVAILSTLVGPALAEVVGPYAVIILASSVGAAWSLGNKNPMPQRIMIKYYIRIILTALLITVFIAHFISVRIGYEESSWLLAPVALMIGSVGDDWRNIIKWIKNRLGIKTPQDKDRGE